MSVCISSEGEYGSHEWSPALICRRCFVCPEPAQALRILADDQELLWTVARRAIEDELVEWRDARRFTIRNNGFAIRESDGTSLNIIRFGPEVGVRIALRALADHLERAS